MPSGYLNHPLPVSVLSLCFGEGPKMFHSFWHCFLHLKRIYTSEVLTPAKKKKKRKKLSTYFGCQILNVLTLPNKNTLFCSQWGERTRSGREHVQMDFYSDKRRGKIGPPTITCLGNIKNSPSKKSIFNRDCS